MLWLLCMLIAAIANPAMPAFALCSHALAIVHIDCSYVHVYCASYSAHMLTVDECSCVHVMLIAQDRTTLLRLQSLGRHFIEDAAMCMFTVHVFSSFYFNVQLLLQSLGRHSTFTSIVGASISTSIASFTQLLRCCCGCSIYPRMVALRCIRAFLGAHNGYGFPSVGVLYMEKEVIQSLHIVISSNLSEGIVSCTL